MPTRPSTDSERSHEARGVRPDPRRTLSNNFLLGITAGRWWRLLREAEFEVDRGYRLRAAALSAASLVNSVKRMVEVVRHGRAWRAVEPTRAPLFVLGHWRSGTTLLHNLLTVDRTRWSFPNTYQVTHPSTFLSWERLDTTLLGGVVRPHRPGDAVPVSFSTPQEDEFAYCLSSLLSPYLTMVFPRRSEQYRRYLTFEDASEEEVRQWRAAVLEFVRKLEVRHGRPPVLKSPPHTARIPLLMRLFPQARFVYMHRNPYDVFRSMRHNVRATFGYFQLQDRDPSTVDDGILETYTELIDAYLKHRDLVPEDRLCEVAFSDLVADPAAEVERIYRTFRLDGFEDFAPELQRYLAGISDYRPNEFSELDRETRGKVARSWARGFEAWDYPT